MDKKVSPGSTWFVVSMTWIEKLQKYLYLDCIAGTPNGDVKESERVHPGPINNDDVLLKIPTKQYLLEKMVKVLW